MVVSIGDQTKKMVPSTKVDQVRSLSVSSNYSKIKKLGVIELSCYLLLG